MKAFLIGALAALAAATAHAETIPYANSADGRYEMSAVAGSYQYNEGKLSVVISQVDTVKQVTLLYRFEIKVIDCASGYGSAVMTKVGGQGRSTVGWATGNGSVASLTADILCTAYDEAKKESTKF